jgi:hypothetical protein
VTTIAADTRIDAGPAALATAGDAGRGWYLYGITRRGSLATLLAEANAGEPAGAAPLELLECSGLAAVVRPVSLDDFSTAALQERLRHASALEAMVRSHNRVVDAIHARQAILPAKLGMVYTHARDIVSALRSTCDALLPQLHRLEGCDEWAVHLYADRATVGTRAAARIPSLARLHEQHAAARPGRAWFIERQLRGELESATRRALVTLAQGAFDRLSGVAVAGQVNPVKHVADAGGEVELLRAAFLVARDGVERFEAEMRTAADASEGLRCECSGPWAPYSFAVDSAGEAT